MNMDSWWQSQAEEIAENIADPAEDMLIVDIYKRLLSFPLCNAMYPSVVLSQMYVSFLPCYLQGAYCYMECLKTFSSLDPQVGL